MNSITGASRNLVTTLPTCASFKRIACRFLSKDYTTHKVLTMEYIEAKNSPRSHPWPLDFDGRRARRGLFRAYLQQVLVDASSWPIRIPEISSLPRITASPC